MANSYEIPSTCIQGSLHSSSQIPNIVPFILTCLENCRVGTQWVSRIWILGCMLFIHANEIWGDLSSQTQGSFHVDKTSNKILRIQFIGTYNFWIHQP